MIRRDGTNQIGDLGLAAVLLMLTAAPALAADVTGLMQQGVQLFNEKKYAEATRLFEQAAAQAPEDAEVHFWLGAAYAEQGLDEKAIGSFQKVISLNPPENVKQEAQKWLDKLSERRQEVPAPPPQPPTPAPPPQPPIPTPPPQPTNVGLRSGVTTNFQTEMQLGPVLSQARQRFRNATIYEKEVQWLFPSGDRASLNDQGVLVIGSPKPLDTWSSKEDLEADLITTVEMLSAIIAGVTDAQKYDAVWYRSRYYAEEEGVFHRLLIAGEGNRECQWVLNVPACVVKHAIFKGLCEKDRTMTIRLRGEQVLQVRGALSQSDNVATALQYGEQDLAVAPSQGAWLLILDALTTPTTGQFYLRGPGPDLSKSTSNRPMSSFPKRLCTRCGWMNQAAVKRCAACRAYLDGEPRRCPRCGQEIPPEATDCEVCQRLCLLPRKDFLDLAQTLKARPEEAAKPLQTHLHFWLGLDRLWQPQPTEKDLQEALDHLRAAFEQETSSAQIAAALSATYRALGQKDQERQMATKAIELGLDPLDLARFYQPPSSDSNPVKVLRHEVQQALLWLEPPPEKNPQPSCALSLWNVWQGDEAWRRSDYAAAKGYYTKAIEGYPQCPEALVGLAYVAANQSATEEAQKKLNEASHWSPQNARVQGALKEFEANYGQEFNPPTLKLEESSEEGGTLFVEARPNNDPSEPYRKYAPFQLTVEDESGIDRITATLNGQDLQPKPLRGEVYQILWNPNPSVQTDVVLHVCAWDKVGNMGWIDARVRVPK
jgi:tetratricopeptide (TPR) repeat protein